jgi:hypothetical protein
MTSKEQIIALSKGNIFDIFGGTSRDSRLTELEKQWHTSDILYIDPFSIARTHEEIEAVIVKMNESLPGSIFQSIGESRYKPKLVRPVLKQVRRRGDPSTGHNQRHLHLQDQLGSWSSWRRFQGQGNGHHHHSSWQD